MESMLRLCLWALDKLFSAPALKIKFHESRNYSNSVFTKQADGGTARKRRPNDTPGGLFVAQIRRAWHGIHLFVLCRAFVGNFTLCLPLYSPGPGLLAVSGNAHSAGLEIC